MPRYAALRYVIALAVFGWGNSAFATEEDLRAAITLCTSQRLSLEEFTSKAEQPGLILLTGSDARAAYEQTADAVYMLRVATALKENVALPNRGEIIDALTTYSMQTNRQRQEAIFAAGQNTLVIVKATPSFGVSFCRLYTKLAIPEDINAQLGPRTLLTKSWDPYIDIRELPLSDYDKTGQVRAIHTPTTILTSAIDSLLSFTHIIEIETPSGS